MNNPGYGQNIIIPQSGALWLVDLRQAAPAEVCHEACDILGGDCPSDETWGSEIRRMASMSWIENGCVS